MKSQFLPAVLGLFILVGCGDPTFADVCDHYGDECGASEQDIAECKNFGAALESQAEELGCENELGDLVACMDENLSCEDQTTACRAEAAAVEACAEAAQE